MLRARALHAAQGTAAATWPKPDDDGLSRRSRPVTSPRAHLQTAELQSPTSMPTPNRAAAPAGAYDFQQKKVWIPFSIRFAAVLFDLELLLNSIWISLCPMLVLPCISGREIWGTLASIILYKWERDLRNAVFVMQFYGRACVYSYSNNKDSLDVVRDMFVFVCWGKSFSFLIQLDLFSIRFGKSFSFSIRFRVPFRFGLDFGRFLLSFYLSEATIILSPTYSSLHRI
jgi:hypothetical protein